MTVLVEVVNRRIEHRFPLAFLLSRTLSSSFLLPLSTPPADSLSIPLHRLDSLPILLNSSNRSRPKVGVLVSQRRCCAVVQ